MRTTAASPLARTSRRAGLADPGGPSTVTSRHAAPRRPVEGRPQPSSSPDARRAARRAAARRRAPLDTRSKPVRRDRLGFPLERSGSTGSTSTRLARAPRRLAEQDLVRRAACSRRAATLTASPVASRSSVPTTTSPVLTPMRTARDAVVPLQLLVQASPAAARPRADARSASSSCTAARRRRPSPRRR